MAHRFSPFTKSFQGCRVRQMEAETSPNRWLEIVDGCRRRNSPQIKKKKKAIWVHVEVFDIKPSSDRQFTVTESVMVIPYGGVSYRRWRLSSNRYRSV